MMPSHKSKSTTKRIVIIHNITEDNEVQRINCSWSGIGELTAEPLLFKASFARPSFHRLT